MGFIIFSHLMMTSHVSKYVMVIFLVMVCLAFSDGPKGHFW
jgi:hypothetical protein